MTGHDVDQILADWLAPAARAPDRQFAARVDTAISELAQLRAAERRYARGLVREMLALASVALAAIIMVRWSELAMAGWLVGLPVALMLLVLFGGARQPMAGSSPAP